MLEKLPAVTMSYNLSVWAQICGDLLLEDHLLFRIIDHLVRLQLEAVVQAGVWRARRCYERSGE